MRFDQSPLADFWQYLDVPWLESDLLRSCLALHAQPPAFNLFLGMLLKVARLTGMNLFQVAFLVLGLILCFCLYGALRFSGLGRLPAAGLALMFMISPSAILYENFLFYTYPVTVLLVSALVCLFLYERTGKTAWALVFFTVIAVVCFTWSAFHLTYYLLVTGAIVLFSGKRRSTFAASLPPLLAVVGLYAKNLIIVGVFSASSWMGMSFWGLASNYLTRDEMNRLQASGEVSEISRVVPFSSLDDYPPEFRRAEPRFAGIPALADPKKSNGEINFNHYGYAAVSKQYLADASRILRHYPSSYLKSLLLSWTVYFQPTHEWLFLHRNAKRISSFIAWWNLPSLWRVDLEPLQRFLFRTPAPPGLHAGFRLYGWRILNIIPLQYLDQEWKMGLTVPLTSSMAFLLLVAWGMVRILRRPSASGPSRAVLAFLCLTVLYVAGVGNMTELGENNRFRFATQPFLLVIFVMAAQEGARWLRLAWGRRAFSDRKP